MVWYRDGIRVEGRPPGSKNKRKVINVGDTFGRWTVLADAGRVVNGNQLYACKCVCGETRNVMRCHLRSGMSTSCGCTRRNGSAHELWRGCGLISGSFWNQIRRCASRAKGRKYAVEFSIDIKYAWRLFQRQKGCCALSGVVLTMNYPKHRRKGDPHTASLDRIDSCKGYVRGNVQWVHKDVNMMKRTLPQDDFVRWCRLIAACNQ